ncbi:guanine nucleotide exchange factor for Rab-3A-like isoform X2 [Ornithodoros turicata]
MAEGQVELPRSSSQGFIMSSDPQTNGTRTPPSPTSDHDETHHPLGCNTSTPVAEPKETEMLSKTSSVSKTQSPVPRWPPAGSRRSASDGAVPDYSISPVLDTTTPERCRSHSDSDERAAGLRARINEKYDQLERELRPNRGRFQRATNGDSSSSSSPTTEGPDSPAVMRLSDSRDGDLALDGQLTADDTCVLSSGSPALTMVELRASDPRQTRRPRSVSVAEVKELAYARLQAELNKAQQELKLKDEEVARLSQIRDEVGAELEDLTASLFEEANNMVREANIKQAAAEKRLKESNLKMEVLQAEVQALKTLMITSTPSRPNPHLHPQLGKSNSGGGHRRSPSNYELSSISSLARRSPPTQSPPPPNPNHVANEYVDFNPEQYEVDPVYHKEFVAWRQNPQLDPSDPFLARIYQEDIIPCLHFAAYDLTQEVLKAIENNSITIEAVSGNSPFPKKCSLLDAPRLCKYRMKLGDSSSWHYISQLCRNRITSVCDFFCYLRYIQQGLVRNGIHEVYWEVIRRRRSIALARLGICLTSQTLPKYKVAYASPKQNCSNSEVSGWFSTGPGKCVLSPGALWQSFIK